MITASIAQYLAAAESVPFVPLGSLEVDVYLDLGSRGLVGRDSWGAYSLTDKGWRSLAAFRAQPPSPRAS